MILGSAIVGAAGGGGLPGISIKYDGATSLLFSSDKWYAEENRASYLM